MTTENPNTAQPPAVPPSPPVPQPPVQGQPPVYPMTPGTVYPQYSQFVPCPRCGNPYPQKVGYTWWGGILGANLFHHVRCPNCKYEYDGKTGKSNQGKITAYILVSVGIVLVIILLAALAH